MITLCPKSAGLRLAESMILGGEVPCAFIEKVKDKNVTEKELIDFCRETLAGFKLPKKVVFGELPKTSTGKIKKFELRKKAKEIN